MMVCGWGLCLSLFILQAFFFVGKAFLQAFVLNFFFENFVPSFASMPLKLAALSCSVMHKVEKNIFLLS
jgi:hypothetical protein